MNKINIRKSFKDEELKENLKEAHERLLKNLDSGKYLMAAFYSFDLARIYNILENRKKSIEYYRSALEYLGNTDFQSMTITLECLLALGKPKEALRAAIESNTCRRPELAVLYEKLGEEETARRIFAELAVEQVEKANRSAFFKPHFLQYVSDLWARAQNPKKARKYNEQAIETWEKMKDNVERPLHTVEEAWLFEEVGYIYEKTGKFETAIEYYEKAKQMYELAYREDPPAVYTHQIDGDWDYYKEIFFYLQLLGTRMFKLRVENPMKYDFRRIKYRMLKLEEQVKT